MSVISKNEIKIKLKNFFRTLVYVYHRGFANKIFANGTQILMFV